MGRYFLFNRAHEFTVPQGIGASGGIKALEFLILEFGALAVLAAEIDAFGVHLQFIRGEFAGHNSEEDLQRLMAVGVVILQAQNF